LTGSERAGRSVAELAGRNLKKCVLELGGSDPFVVGVSANMDLTVPMAVTARVQNNGQACIASKRYIVVRDRADEFLEKFVAAMAAVQMGDPMDPAHRWRRTRRHRLLLSTHRVEQRASDLARGL